MPRREALGAASCQPSGMRFGQSLGVTRNGGQSPWVELIPLVPSVFSPPLSSLNLQANGVYLYSAKGYQRVDVASITARASPGEEHPQGQPSGATPSAPSPPSGKGETQGTT